MTACDDAPVLLVGAGAAGFSAALWLTDFDVPFDWIDSSGQVGGMLRRVYNRIDNYPGGIFEQGLALCEEMELQRNQRQIPLCAATLQHVKCMGSAIEVTVDDTTRNIKRLLLATGTTYRQLDIPGETEGLGRWVSQSATADAPRFAGRRVAVVGGGDAGFENALRLAEQDCQVTLLLRSPPCARPAFLEAVDAHPAIEIAPIPSVVRRIESTGRGCRIYVDQQNQPITMEVACLFVRIGVDPVIPRGCEQLESDDEGFLLTDERAITSHPRVLAAGDITSTSLRSVATAVGQGARMARTCAQQLGTAR